MTKNSHLLSTIGIFASVFFASMILAGASADQASEASLVDQVKADISNSNQYSATGATVQLRPDGGGCTLGNPFEFAACGPMTTIHLELTPGMFGSFEHTSTQGGDFAQMMSALVSMQGAADADSLNEMARQSASQEGSSINIAIPLIDYGYEGTFNNASISMKRTGADRNRGIFEAIGPTDALPGPRHRFPLSGSVTILQYSPTVLRGSFSGALVDLSKVDMTPDDVTLPVHRNLSGTFNIVAPWRGDSRTLYIGIDDPEQAVLDDVRQFFPGMDLSGQLEKQTTASNGPASDGEDVRMAGSASACDCSCNNVDTTSNACISMCAGTFNACRGKPLPGISLDTMADAVSNKKSEASAVAEAIAELREKLLVQIDKSYGGSPHYQKVKDSTLKSFDEVESLDAKYGAYRSVGGKPDCSPPDIIRDSMKLTLLMFCRAAR